MSTEFKIEDKILTIKRARTLLGSERNTNIRKAEELIKFSEKSSGKEVKILWLQKERQVTVDGDIAFAQPPGEARGTFQAPYLDLILP